VTHATSGEHGLVAAADRADGAGTAVRAPVQERSRRRWAQVLDAGVALIEEGGYDAFTIAAVCERAEVPPRFIYERVDTKDALFLAVYEHGMQRVRAGEAVFDDPSQWAGLSTRATVELAVRAMAGLFERNRALMRSVVLDSSRHAEVRRRGARYADALRERFAVRLRPVLDDGVPVDAVFRSTFASLVFRTAYGDDFLHPHVTEPLFVDELVEIATRSLGLA
jgi:AcrR family transcriptional regulator